MKHTLVALSFGVLAGGLALAAQEPTPVEAPATIEARWFADYDEAVAVAKQEGKDLFVDFTGSDWCGWCIRLHDEVFAHDEWISAASKDYVFVALDFPNAEEIKAKVPNPKRNRELSEKHNVAGFPTILLMTADGVAYAQTGYQAGGPEAYVAHMNEIAASGKKAMAASKVVVDAFTAAEGDDAKWTAWDALVAAYNDMDASSPFVAPLEEHVRWAMDADKENASGKKGIAVAALLGKGIVDDDITAFVTANDPKNEKGMLEKIAAAKFGMVRDDASAKAAVAALREINALGFKDKTQGFEMNFTAARWCAGPLADDAGKVEFAKKAMELGTDDEDMLAALKEMIG